MGEIVPEEVVDFDVELSFPGNSTDLSSSHVHTILYLFDVGKRQGGDEAKQKSHPALSLASFFLSLFNSFNRCFCCHGGLFVVCRKQEDQRVSGLEPFLTLSSLLSRGSCSPRCGLGGITPRWRRRQDDWADVSGSSTGGP